MTEREQLAELTRQTKAKSEWPAMMTHWLRLLEIPDCKVQAKVLWLLGEAGLAYPEAFTADMLERVVSFQEDADPLLRARAITAMGRIGRGNSECMMPYLPRILSCAKDADESVRLSMVWACENIATVAPAWFAQEMNTFVPLLSDTAERVRMEAPEIFRVMGKRLPDSVVRFRSILVLLSQADKNPVVRVHAAGAVRAMDEARAAE